MTRHPSNITVMVAVLFAATHFGCRQPRGWHEAEEFRRALRCGMSPAAVAELSRTHGGTPLQRSVTEDHWSTHWMRNGGTVFWFTFPGGGLQMVQERRYHGMTGLRKSVRTDVCSNETFSEVSLLITAPVELAGGAVFVDGARRLGLSHGPDVRALIGGLPSGSHEVRIEKGGYKPVLAWYEYRSNEYWPPERPLHLRITRAAIQPLGEEHRTGTAATSKAGRHVGPAEAGETE